MFYRCVSKTVRMVPPYREPWPGVIPVTFSVTSMLAMLFVLEILFIIK